MKEIWKDIVGYEGLYQISNLGRIKSLPRFVNNNKTYSSIGYYTKEKILKPWNCKTHNNDSYLYITLCKNGKHYKKFVHRLVAENFIENPLKKREVNHIDGNKENNHYKNLEWCTCKENQVHSWKFLKRKSDKQKAKILDELIVHYKNGDWNTVLKIFEDLSEVYDVTINIYRLPGE